jgi:hypothetical protein
MDNRETNLLKKVREHVQKGTYFLSQHAMDRRTERAINLPDILFVLEFGSREKDKDSFDTKRQAWKYAIRGKTTRGIDVRVIVAFEEAMVIITVMRLK